MLSKLKKIILWLNVFSVFISTKVALAVSNDPRAGLDIGASEAGYNVINKPSLQSVIIVIIKYALGFIGIVFIALILLAGFQWMTSAGSEDKVKKAKDNLLHAVTGLVIILLAYAITWFVADVLIKATTPGYWSYWY